MCSLFFSSVSSFQNDVQNDSIEEEEDQVFETDQEEEDDEEEIDGGGNITAATAEEEEFVENVSAALVVEAARNRALPPVPPGYTQTIDPETDDVFYTHPTTGARVTHFIAVFLFPSILPSFILIWKA